GQLVEPAVEPFAGRAADGQRVGGVDQGLGGAGGGDVDAVDVDVHGRADLGVLERELVGAGALLRDRLGTRGVVGPFRPGFDAQRAVGEVQAVRVGDG